MNDPRRAAVAALMRQEKNGYANLVLKSALQRFDGTPRDRALAAAIFYGTVERLVTTDWILSRFLARPLASADAAVRAVLRTGLYQARWMQSVPVHAAVNESVALCRRMGRGSAAGMVNAVLRKAAVFDLESAAFSDDIERLCVRYSVSRPVAELLLRTMPEQCEAVLAASFQKPAFCVRANTLKNTPAELCAIFRAHGIEAREGDVPGSVIAQWHGDLAAFPPFREGRFHVQGQASQLACQLVGACPGETVVDLCAAPGGKSATLAQWMENRGALISRDAAANRVPLIRKQLERLGITCGRVRAADGAVYDEALQGADRVLCDVPCSGLGTLSKKPDVRYKTLEGLEQLVDLQQKILETGARYVRRGGVCVYSTCTLNPEENGDVVRRFLKAHDEFSLCSASYLPHWARQTDCGICVEPLTPETDGFFIAVLRREQ